jgi:uncharacterized glyoxalase superfamily protein PhnB
MIMPMLAVRDLKASLDFYVRGLGFETVTLMKDAEGNDNFAIVALGPTSMIGIGPYEAPQPVGSGVELMVYVPDEVDIDQHHAMAVANGISVPNGIKTEYWGDRLYTVTDPDGFRLSLCKTVQQLTNEEIAPVHAEKSGVA